MTRALFGLVLAATTLGGGAILAAPPDDLSPRKSRFTTIDLKTCKMVQRHPDGATYRCDGFAGVSVQFAEGDLRAFISFGRDAARRRAATQTLAPFNTVFEARRTRATVEWRTERRGGRERPYAAIVRYFTSHDERKGQVLVVTRITEREACHVAYIDALANPGPVALARSAADELAASFDCKQEPRVVGVKGKSPM